MFLLNTDIFSMLRFPDRHPGVREWVLAQRPEELYVSALTMGELFGGVEELGQKDLAQGLKLRRWFQDLAGGFEGRILSVDTETALLWGKLSGRARDANPIDVLTVATALVHKLVVVTADEALMKDIWDVPLLNPDARTKAGVKSAA